MSKSSKHATAAVIETPAAVIETPVTVNETPVTVNETSAPAKKGWRTKSYYVNLEKFNEPSTVELLAKSPNQVRIMMKHFSEKFNNSETAAQGRVMCQSAIDEGGLKTVIEPHILFAYYRKHMEQFGLTLVN